MAENEFGSRLDLAALLAALEAREDLPALRNLAGELRSRGVTPRPGRLRVAAEGDVAARIVIIADPDEEEPMPPARCPHCGKVLP